MLNKFSIILIVFIVSPNQAVGPEQNRESIVSKPPSSKKCCAN